MANVHILDKQGALYRAAFHVPIPGGNNSAGVAWSAALLRSGIGGTTVLPDGDGTGGTISATEKTAITNGTVYEVVDNIDPMSGGTGGAAINATLDALYAAKQTEVQQLVQGQLSQYGRTR